jgi:hypothetical protein
MNKYAFVRFLSIFLMSMLMVTQLGLSLSLFAQTPPPANPIDLQISRVTVGDQTQNTVQKSPNIWSFDGEMTLDDSIRYRWANVALDTKYKEKPQKQSGYLKVYKQDDSKEENLILEVGSSPLPIAKIAPKITAGENTILFVYIDSTGAPANPATKVSFTFRFKNITSKPQISIESPKPDIVLAQGVNKEFIINIQNFSLEAIGGVDARKGKMNLYANDTQPTSFIATLNTSTQIDERTAQVRFFSKDIDFAKIGDNMATKLIFVLTKADGTLLDTRAELVVKTNYKNQLDVGLPKVTILEPKGDRSDLSFTGSDTFVLQVDNFQLLKERKSGAIDGKSGYIQIFVDDAPYKIVWGETKFSLNEIGFLDQSEGRKTVKVQLVNTDFTKLDVPATDSREIIYVPERQNSLAQNPTNSEGIRNSNWRTIIVVLTIALIIGGITVLITKG